MIDPLAEVVKLLQPAAEFSKVVVAAGRWRIRRSDPAQPFYCVLLEGTCRVAVDGHDPIEMQPGDFVLTPAAHGVTVSSLKPPPKGVENRPVQQRSGEFRIGVQEGPADMRMLGGHCSFGSPDAGLLVSLLPQIVHVRGEQRLATLVAMIGEETRQQRPAREIVLSRLLEVLLIEALRSASGTTASQGLVRGLADNRLAVAIRAMHERPTHSWTIAGLAKEAALSRSAFFDRFNRTVGVAPMEYLLAWRMAMAKDFLRRQEGSIAAIAERVGYASASTFSVAFSRHVGMAPTQYAKVQ